MGQSKDAKMERSEFSVIDGDHSYLQRQGGGPTPNSTNSSGEACGSALITGKNLPKTKKKPRELKGLSVHSNKATNQRGETCVHQKA
jgi:hypothetical protein